MHEFSEQGSVNFKDLDIYDLHILHSHHHLLLSLQVVHHYFLNQFRFIKGHPHLQRHPVHRQF